jgi:O-antigen/teichoic acid export membrane protein
MDLTEPVAGPPPFSISAIGRHSMIYGVGMLLTKAVAIVMMPIYTRLLTPTDYGVLALITMTFEVVTIFAGSRIAIGVFHFYHKAPDERGRRAVLSTAFLLLTSTYAAAAAATVWVAPQIAARVFGPDELYTTLIRLAAISMAFEGMILVPYALLQLQARSKAFVLVALARLGLQVALNLIFLIPFSMGITGVLWGSVITHAVVGVALGVRLLGSQGSRLEASIVRDLVRFGLPLVVMQVATFVLTFGDRYFLNQAGTTADVGLYGLAYQFGFLVATIGYGPFAQVWDPQRFAIAKRPDRDAIFARVFVYLNIALISAALGIALFAGDALRVIATPDFHAAAVFVPLLAAAYVLQSWGFFLNLGIYVTERTEYFTAANWAAAIVAVGGFLWLIPPWLAWGAVVTTLVSKSVLFGLVYLFSQRLWHVDYRWRRVVQIAGLAVAAGVLAELAPPLLFWASIALHAALFAAYSALVWTFVLTRDERRAVSGGLRGRLPLLTLTS